MTDRIEKIVSKWGFERKEGGNAPLFERRYRDFHFIIKVYGDTINLYTSSISEDSLMFTDELNLWTRDFKMTDFYIDDNIDWWKLEWTIKNFIQTSINEFFAYDLFHDKEWKDGKEV